MFGKLSLYSRETSLDKPRKLNKPYNKNYKKKSPIIKKNVDSINV